MTILDTASDNGGMILGKIDNMHLFAGKLLESARLNPSVYQSGNFQAKKTHMAKYNSHVLHYAPHECSANYS